MTRRIITEVISLVKATVRTKQISKFPEVKTDVTSKTPHACLNQTSSVWLKSLFIVFEAVSLETLHKGIIVYMCLHMCVCVCVCVFVC